MYFSNLINSKHGKLFIHSFLPAIALILGLAAHGSAQITITQSSSQTITPANSASCNDGTGVHTDNSYWRAFTLSSFNITSAFAVQSISFGIEQATATAATQPVNVRIYANSGAAFPGGTRSLLATVPVAVGNQSATILSVPIAATIPAGNQLVLEVNTPDGSAAGNMLFIGSNAAAQTGPSYISAADCGITTPTNFAAIGFPDTHIVFNVTGAAVTAAGAQIGGQVISSTGKPVSGAVVTLTDLGGNARRIRTNVFGKFGFDNINSGETYIIGVTSKQYRFNPQAVNVLENLNNLTITAEQ